MRSETLSTLPDVLRTPAISSCRFLAMVAAAVLLSSASFRTSSATTAKPRPASPARAASMEALRASRFVCSAIPVIAPTTPWMRSALPDRVFASSVSDSVSATTDMKICSISCSRLLPESALSPTDATVSFSSEAKWASPCAVADISSDDAYCDSVAWETLWPEEMPLLTFSVISENASVNSVSWRSSR